MTPSAAGKQTTRNLVAKIAQGLRRLTRMKKRVPNPPRTNEELARSTHIARTRDLHNRDGRLRLAFGLFYDEFPAELRQLMLEKLLEHDLSCRERILNAAGLVSCRLSQRAPILSLRGQAGDDLTVVLRLHGYWLGREETRKQGEVDALWAELMEREASEQLGWGPYQPLYELLRSRDELRAEQKVMGCVRAVVMAIARAQPTVAAEASLWSEVMLALEVSQRQD